MRRFTLVLAMAGCGNDAGSAQGGDFDSFDDDDLPAGVCRDTDTDTEGSTDSCDTEGTTIGAGTAAGSPGDANTCEGSGDCMGGVCAAAFDPETLERGAMQCQFACVPLLADALWCADDGSCCDANAVCTERGYCVTLDNTDTDTE